MDFEIGKAYKAVDSKGYVHIGKYSGKLFDDYEFDLIYSDNPKGKGHDTITATEEHVGLFKELTPLEKELYDL